MITTTFLTYILIVTSSPCGLNVPACTAFPNGWMNEGQIEVFNPIFTSFNQHEVGHLKYQKYFDPNHPKYKETMKFWSKQPLYWQKGDSVPEDWRLRPTENMASWYANWKIGDSYPKTPKAIVKWFKNNL